LQASNVLLKLSNSEQRGLTAKVSDFGLSFKMDQAETHVSSMFQGTQTHMAPEVMESGCLSKAADV
jgi:serine/threonine protein kinase